LVPPLGMGIAAAGLLGGLVAAQRARPDSATS
jgi:hypothetical protein